MGLSKRKSHHHGSSSSKKLRRKEQRLAKEAATVAIDEIVQMSMQDKCDLIAELSESILENPTAAFSTNKQSVDETANDMSSQLVVSKMRRLLEMSNVLKNGNDAYIARLGLLSLLAIFQDIVPSYRIRLPPAAEAAVRVTKETKSMWDYERSLLQHYQQYLKLLERTWERRKDHKENQELAVTALLCLCELLKCAYHFNFHSNICGLVVRHMNSTRDEIRTQCCLAVEHVFEQDAQGEVALEVTRLIAKLVRDGIAKSSSDSGYNFSVQPHVLRSFSCLPLRVHVDEAQAAKIAAAAKAKKRKRDKATAEIEDELREGSAKVDKIVLAKSQADTLEAVMITYFRILRSTDLRVQSSLLSPTLEGLAKFAHLVNIDTVVDVLAVLKDLLQNVDTLPLDSALNCVLTAFHTLQGPGREMKIDQKEYLTPLYSQLPRVCFESGDSLVVNDEQQKQSVTDLSLKCLSLAFLKRREYSTVRIASFAKRLCSISLHAPSTTAGPLLAFVKQLLQRYPSIHPLLENEQDVVMSGVYDASVHDPEHANPFATSCWELSLLRFHVHPKISTQAASVTNTSATTLVTAANALQATPDKVRSEMIRNANELYIEYRPHTKKHPLRMSSNQKRQRVRFIKPRKESLSRDFC